MAYNLVNGVAVKDNDILVYSQLKAVSFKAIIKNIDAKVTGSTIVFTTDNNGKRFHPSLVRVLVSDANTVTLVPTVSIGTNSPNFNDVLLATALTGMTGLNNMTNYNLLAMMNSIAPNTEVKVNVSVAATATTCKLDIAIFGDYE